MALSYVLLERLRALGLAGKLAQPQAGQQLTTNLGLPRLALRTS